MFGGRLLHPPERYVAQFLSLVCLLLFFFLIHQFPFLTKSMVVVFTEDVYWKSFLISLSSLRRFQYLGMQSKTRLFTKEKMHDFFIQKNIFSFNIFISYMWEEGRISHAVKW
jgi:hypothetical protein